jgi:chromosome segregation ATPase
VKHGCREATMEIELQRKPSMRKNPVITRVIKREGNQSTYFINGKQSVGREVQALANSFNIQIDNLCQFLPQDKVVEFAMMSPVDLLASTQRAVAGPEMTNLHDELKRLRKEQSKAMKNDKDARAQLAHLQSRQEGQRPEVERLRERAKVKLRLDRLEQSRAILRYQAAKTISQEAKERAQAITQELKHLKSASAPTLAKLRSKEEYEAGARAFKSRCETELKASLQECEKKTKEIMKLDDDMKEKSTQIEAEKAAVSKNKNTIAQEQNKVRDLKRKKAEAPENFDVTGLTNEMQVLRGRVTALQQKSNELEPRKIDLRERGVKRRDDAKDLAARLETFGSHANQQEEKLKEQSEATWKAWDWIQKNQDQFTEHVYGPPIVECSLKDPRMADAIESIMQQTDFKFITAQNTADFHLLQKKLVGSTADGGLGLHDVSLRERSNGSLDQFRPPVSPEQMQNLGLSGWALDCLQGPVAVLAQLCVEKGLHRCGISSKEPTQQQHDEIGKTDIQSYVAGQKVYHFLRRREYGAAGYSARVQDVRRARYWTDQPVDLGRKAALQRDLNEARGEAAAIHAEFSDVVNQIKQLEVEKKQIIGEINAKKEEKEAIQNARVQYDRLDIEIQTKEESIKMLRESIHGVGARINGIQKDLDGLLVAKTEAVLEFAAATREVKSKTARLLEADVILVEAVSDLQVATAQNNEVVQAIQQKEAEKNTATEMYRQQHDLALRSKNEAMIVANEAKRLARDGDDSFNELLEHVCQSLNTPENLEAEIDAEKAKLELTEGGNTQTIAEFERRARDIETLQAQVQDANERRAEFSRDIKKVRDRWEPRLDEIVAQINDAFSDSFARIGCAGQVAVHKASSDDPDECAEENGGSENGLDFEKWSIEISVKFRESEPLSLLDSHRQSGGERAVSTIFYLMALQSLSRAPFRVVDEINQGMDPRNERMVHGRMVDIAADDGGSQYFLITPKLLSGLKYRRGMTVLCIVSGENVPAARERDDEGEWHDGPKVDFNLFVTRARDLGIGAAVGGRRMEFGMGFGQSLGSASQSPAVGA